jgi:hypothetical protein
LRGPSATESSASLRRARVGIPEFTTHRRDEFPPAADIVPTATGVPQSTPDRGRITPEVDQALELVQEDELLIKRVRSHAAAGCRVRSLVKVSSDRSAYVAVGLVDMGAQRRACLGDGAATPRQRGP